MYQIIIKVKGTDVTKDVDLQWIECHSRINHIPELRIRITEGPAQTTEFKQVDNSKFAIGTEIQIHAGIADKEKPIFAGIITEQHLGLDHMVYLDVVAYGDAIKLTEGPVNLLFEPKKSDKDIMGKIFSNAGLNAKVADSKIKHGQYFCYQQTPWRTLMARVLANGFLFSASPDGNEIIDPVKHSPKTHKISLLESGLQTFELRQDARSIIKKTQVTAWDIKKQARQKPVNGSASLSKLTGSGKEDLKLSDYLHQDAAPLSPEEVTAKANAQQVYRTLDRFQGTLQFDAETFSNKITDQIKLADVVDLQDFGNTCSGKYLVTGIRHSRAASGWQIRLTLGVPLNHTLFSDWFRPPPVPNLTGKVADFKEDPEKLERLPVWLPTITDDNKKVVWARLLSPFASAGEGLHLPPNKDDEVIVGFIGGDSRHPVILGAVHNPKHKPPLAYDKENAKKGLIFKDPGDKEGNKGPLAALHFDSKQKIMRLQGGKQAGLNLDDKAGPDLHFTKDSKDSFDKGSALSSIVVAEKEINLIADKKQQQTLAKNIDIKVDGNVTVKTTLMEIK